MRYHTTPVHLSAKRLGEQIEKFRLSRNMRQEDVASDTGLSRSTINRLESGEGGTIDTLIRVLRSLGVDDRLETLVPDARVSPLDPRPASKSRKRARPANREAENEPWSWGDDQ